jgi:hypothetical protein
MRLARKTQFPISILSPLGEQYRAQASVLSTSQASRNSRTQWVRITAAPCRAA